MRRHLATLRIHAELPTPECCRHERRHHERNRHHPDHPDAVAEVIASCGYDIHAVADDVLKVTDIDTDLSAAVVLEGDVAFIAGMYHGTCQQADGRD